MSLLDVCQVVCRSFRRRSLYLRNIVVFVDCYWYLILTHECHLWISVNTIFGLFGNVLTNRYILRCLKGVTDVYVKINIQLCSLKIWAERVFRGSRQTNGTNLYGIGFYRCVRGSFVDLSVWRIIENREKLTKWREKNQRLKLSKRITLYTQCPK